MQNPSHAVSDSQVLQDKNETTQKADDGISPFEGNKFSSENPEPLDEEMYTKEEINEIFVAIRDEMGFEEEPHYRSCSNFKIPHYFQEIQPSDSETKNPLISKQFLDELSDDEVECQVNSTKFYKYQDSVTTIDSWKTILPPKNRLAFVPYCTPTNGRHVLAYVDSQNHFEKQTSLESTYYLACLSIYNHSETLLTYKVKSSQPHSLNIKRPLGFVNPRETEKVLLYSFAKGKSHNQKYCDLDNLKVNIYVAPFEIVGKKEINSLSWNETETKEMHGIGDKHFVDLWNAYETPWFPTAEIHKLENFTTDEPNLKSCPGVAKWRPDINEFEFDHGDGLPTIIHSNSFLNLQQEVVKLNEKMENFNSRETYRMIGKICKFILCSAILFLIFTRSEMAQESLESVLGIKTSPPPAKSPIHSIEHAVAWWKSLGRKCN